MLVRTVECLEGRVEVELICEPVFGYGREPATWTLVDGSRHTADATGAGQTIRLQTDLALGIEGGQVRARHTLEPGERIYCALSWAEQLAVPADVDEADAAACDDGHATGVPGWTERGSPTIAGVTRSSVRLLRSKGLTYMPTGATVAALTTSLPETPGGERNWDYRYTWIRDSTFTLQALHYLNLDWEADEFMEFVADVEANEDGGLQIMYGIDGRRDLTESTLDHLSGYAGARPVRIGNGAFDQRQNDVFGAALDSILLHTRRSKRLPARLWPIIQAQAECAVGVWREPGPGHLGGTGRAAALRLVEAHVLGRTRPCGEARRDPRRPGARRKPGRESPKRSARTSSSTVSASGASCASTTRPTRWMRPCCWPPCSGSCPVTTIVCAKTVLAVADELTDNGFALRYRTEETDDGLSGEEGTFLICSFWLVSALAIVGEQQRAHDLMERLLRIASPLGLYAEEFDVATGRHLGNFPQAFSHLALIEAAGRIILAERIEEIS